MKVRDLFLSDVARATKDMTLARAGALMRKYEIGSLPVVDRADRVIGLVTDRDCFLEATRRDEALSEIFVDEVMTDRPAVCSVDDDLQECLSIMRKSRASRLPVVDEDDRLEGLISIDDLIDHAVERGGARETPYEEIVETLSAIAEPYEADRGVRGPRREARSNGGRPSTSRDRHRGESSEVEEPRRSRTARAR